MKMVIQKLLNNKINEEKSMIYGAYFKDVNENKLRQLGIMSGVEVISIKRG